MIHDPATPDYAQESFPQEAFPRYLWEGGTRPEGFPASAWTTETSHRDGQQGGTPLSTAQGVRLYELMNAFTGSSGAIRQAEFFVYRASDRAMLEAALERHQSGAAVEPTTWIRASAKDVALLASLGVKESGLLASVSDYHVFHKFTPGGRRQAATRYLEAVERTLDAGIRPRLHLEDATRAAMDFVAPFVEAVMTLAAPYGPTLAPKFRVCDTMGVGLPDRDVALPRSVPKLIGTLRALGVASEALEFHPHNDTHMVVANCLAAVRAGCSVINGTLLGKGERTGNAPLEGVLLHLIGMGYFDAAQPDFTALNELVALYETLHQGVPAKYPLYGRDAHRTRAGIHADGLNKFWWMYAFCDTQKLLGRPLEVSITKESGLAGLIFLVKQHTGRELAKDDSALLGLHAWVQAEFDAGRVTAIEWEELRERLA